MEPTNDKTSPTSDFDQELSTLQGLSEWSSDRLDHLTDNIDVWDESDTVNFEPGTHDQHYDHIVFCHVPSGRHLLLPVLVSYDDGIQSCGDPVEVEFKEVTVKRWTRVRPLDNAPL